MFASKRLGKELQKAQKGLPPGVDLVKADDFKEWHMDIKVLDSNPLYQGQTYRLQFRFTQQYPIVMGTLLSWPNFFADQTWTSSEAPEVTFLELKHPSPSEPIASQKAPAPTTNSTSAYYRPIPIHPHIYSNGFICLDLLGSAGWSPVQSVESVCMSLQSMLTGNTKNERPPGDEEFVRTNAVTGKRPKDIGWWYHNDGV